MLGNSVDNLQYCLYFPVRDTGISADVMDIVGRFVGKLINCHKTTLFYYTRLLNYRQYQREEKDMTKYILALDQGTTSSRAIVFSTDGQIISQSKKEFTQYYPNPGWVEHNPAEILESQFEAIRDVLKSGVEISCIGITNQRETVVVWDRNTGKPVYNAIVWQCRRTSDFCEELKANGFFDIISQKTGLGIDAYFSASKIKWILDNIPDGSSRAKNGLLACGTIDSWLIYNLTGGKVHATDVSNASRTMLFNIHTLQWDDELCEIFSIPKAMLPKVSDSAGVLGYIDAKAANLPEIIDSIPISGVAGDQQAALFGQTCFNVGDVKNTYGTGCFTLMNTGNTPVEAKNGLLSTVGWKIGKEVTYALEGSVFNAGSAIQWIRDNLGIIKTSGECDIFAEDVSDNGGVYFVPAFTGLGAPYWDMYARGIITGITRGTTKAHICRAVLEGIAFQVCDLIDAMGKTSGCKISSLKVDGGASVSDFLMAFQANMLCVEVDRPEITETTALGAAFLAGMGIGIWKDKSELYFARKTQRIFKPEIDQIEREEAIRSWHNAVRKALEKS
jgi:glycerol kinase